MTTSFVYFCRKSTDLSWEGDEPSTTVAEEEVAPPVEESTPAPGQSPRRRLLELRCPMPAWSRVSVLLWL
jgi:hypothetical protein